MNYHKCSGHHSKYDCCSMPDYEMDMSYMKEKHPDGCFSDICADMSQLKCKSERECVKTYKAYYKLYKICHYRLYKVCPCCGHEFDFHRHYGVCGRCGLYM